MISLYKLIIVSFTSRNEVFFFKSLKNIFFLIDTCKYYVIIKCIKYTNISHNPVIETTFLKLLLFLTNIVVNIKLYSTSNLISMKGFFYIITICKSLCIIFLYSNKIWSENIFKS